MASYLDLEKFAVLVKNKRGDRGLRAIAASTGISAATISRVERGKIPDLVTFLAFCDWLEIPPSQLIKNTDETPDTDNYQAICAKLRSDPKLKPAIAEAIAVLIENAYQQAIFSFDKIDG